MKNQLKMTKMQEEIKRVKKIAIYIILGIINFALTFYFLKVLHILESDIPINPNFATAMMMLMLFFLVAGVGYYGFMATKSQKLDDEEKQLKIYVNSVIVKFASLSATGLIATILMALHYQLTYLAMVGIVVVYLIASFPSELRFKKDFKKRELFD